MRTLDVALRGAPWELLRILAGPGPYPREVLLDGPAGTGKSMGACHVLYWIAHAFPGARLLAVRKTRVSLTESFCVTWEKTLPHGDECLEGPARSHRHSYKWSNGSELVLGGLDQPTRLYSTEWDFVYPEECGELTEDEWERFLRSLRNGMCPFQVIAGATNPYWQTHWANKRFTPLGPPDSPMPAALRLYSRHTDNPALYDDQGSITKYGAAYIATLQGLSGVRRLRLLDGQWVAAEGLIWENFDPARHEISAGFLREKKDHYGSPKKGLWLQVKDGDATREVEIKWTAGALDWGYTAPGVLLVFGVDSERHAYMLAEIYRTKQTLDWWADRVVEVHKEFGFTVIVADPSKPEAIEQLNVRLSEACGRQAGGLVIAAENQLTTRGGGDMGGLDMVRWALGDDGQGIPRLVFLRDSLRHGPDPELLAKSKPVCTVQEIPAYTFLRAREDKVDDPLAEKDERPDPTCADHGCDATRYFVCYAWPRDLSPAIERERFPTGTLGQILGHDDLRDQML